MTVFSNALRRVGTFMRHLSGRGGMKNPSHHSSEIPVTQNSNDPSSMDDASAVNEAKTARFDSVTRDLTEEPQPEQPSGEPQFSAVSDKGIVRLNNEDSVFTLYSTNVMADGIPPFGIFILADGMGGHESGEKASAMAVRAAANFILHRLYIPFLLNNDDDRPPIAEILIAAVKTANDAVSRSIPDGGTTLSIMVLIGDWAHFAHVGDSRIYLITREAAEPLTRDHSYVQRLIELNQITPEESKNHPQRNVLYRAIGQQDTIEVDTLSRRLSKGASVLLCSDGIWDVLTAHQIREIVTSGAAPQQICEKLCALAITQGSMDNVSTILVRMPA